MTPPLQIFVGVVVVNGMFSPSQGLMLLLQNLPTYDWGDAEITLLVAEAYRLKYTFADAPNHLQMSK